MPSPDTTYIRLRELHQQYVEKVGRLMADDREDLVPEAISDYADEALREIAASRAAYPSLKLGGWLPTSQSHAQSTSGTPRAATGPGLG
jgi:hypothetical protein